MKICTQQPAYSRNDASLFQARNALRLLPVKAVSACLLFCALLQACAPRNEDISRNVQSDLSILDDSIQVSVKNGEVTLSGQVEDHATRNAAESVVRDEKGVTSVVNNISVKETLPPVIPADTNKTPPLK